MPSTLYSTSTAFPVLTGYSTRSFDSGLLLWQGTYITRDTSAPPFAEGDPIPSGDYGAIDGLFVHPAPVLKKSPGPLAEWTVTAYGRLNATGRVSTKYTIGDFYASSSSFGVNIKATLPEYIQKIVLPNNQFPDFSNITAQEIAPLSVQMNYYVAENGLAETSTSPIYVPYQIWEDWVMGDRLQPIIYNGALLTTSVFYAYSSSTPFSSRQRRSFLSVTRTDSANFGLFTEYTTSFRTGYQLLFVN